jgi:hypothetical protein
LGGSCNSNMEEINRFILKNLAMANVIIT